MIRSFKVYSLSNFQACNTVLLTIVTMLYITSPGLTYNRNLYLFIPFTLFSHPHLLPSVSLQSVLCIYEFWGFFLFHIKSEITQYLSFSVWLISLIIASSRSIHVVANGKISFSFTG